MHLFYLGDNTKGQKEEKTSILLVNRDYDIIKT